VWTGLSIAFAVHLTFWFFDVNSSILWVMMLGYVASKVYGPLSPASLAESAIAPKRLFLAAAELMIALAIFLHGVIPLKAAYDLNTAVGGEWSLEQRLNAFYRVMGSSAPQTFHTTELYTRFIGRLAPLYNQSRRDLLTYSIIDLSFKHGFLEAKRNISRNPEEERVYMDQARMSLLANIFYGNRAYLGGAVKTLRHAIKVAPLRPEPRVLLGNAFMVANDTAAALAQFDSALRTAPLYGSTYIQFAKVAVGRHQLPEAIGYLSMAVKNGSLDAGLLYWKVVKEMETKGRTAEAASLARTYLETKDTPFAAWKGDCPAVGGLIAYDRMLLNHLPIQLLQTGKPGDAILAAQAFAACVPKSSSTAVRFGADVMSGKGDRWVKTDFLDPDA
jgi:tetratricopeptide (TPR) repeat protein